MTRRWLLVITLLGGIAVLRSTGIAQAPIEAPIVVVQTVKGTFAFVTFPDEAPRTVAHIVALVRQGFYDGQRVHRAIPSLVAQFGDPQSRDLASRDRWGRGVGASSGTPIGIAEISKKHTHQIGAVGVAHMGDPAQADSQIYITLARHTDLDGHYTVFGQVIEGAEVPALLEVGDRIDRVYLRTP